LRKNARKIYLIFNNFVISLSISVIFALGLTPGHATFHCMNIFVPSQWIAGMIPSRAVIIMLPSIELGNNADL